MPTFRFDWEKFQRNEYLFSVLTQAFLSSENRNGITDTNILRIARESRLRERGYTEETALQAMLDKKLSFEEYCEILGDSS